MSAADIDLALAELEPILAGLTRLNGALERHREALVQDRLALPPCDTPPFEHRRRPGRLSKIGADPELQAFILPRLDRLTYHQIADAVAAHFPPEPRVRPSDPEAPRTARAQHGNSIG
ncbi:MAG: hypothetical protein U1E59_00095 [Amaricoccus sp.]